jgi:hypothetical protein
VSGPDGPVTALLEEYDGELLLELRRH